MNRIETVGSFSPLERGQGVCHWQSQCRKLSQRLCLFLFFLLISTILYAQETSGDGIRIIPQSLTVSDDSVHIDLKITATGIRIPSDESLSLIPSLHFGKKKVVLPPVVLSGSRRARFDRREETVNPDRNKPLAYHTWIGVRRGNNYTLSYRVSIPYASWMEHAELRLKQVSKDCCTELVLADEVLTTDIELPSPCATMAGNIETVTHPLPPLERRKEYSSSEVGETVVEEEEVKGLTAQEPMKQVPVKQLFEQASVKREFVREPEPEPVERERRVAVTLYVDYVKGGSRVDPSYGNNSVELRKAEKMLVPLLGNADIYIKEIRITGYASPDGAYYDNEALAKARSLGFRSYLTRSYGLQDYPFRTAWVAEDWEGLRKLIKGKPYETAVSFIIDNYGIFEGRERYLMDLQGRRPYQDMLQNLFPKLRRIELSILYNERNGYEE